MNQLATVTANPPPALPTVVWPSDATSLMTLCKELSQARTLPQWCQRSPADLFFAVQAMLRLRQDPFLSLKHVSMIRNNLFFDGQLCNAMVNNSGRVANNLSFEYEGEGDDRTVTVRGRLINETEMREVRVRLGGVKTEGNANWRNNPDQQLGYAGARMWARRHCPEVLLGVLFSDEADSMIDVTPPRAGRIDPSLSTEKREELVDAQSADNVTTERVPDLKPSDAESSFVQPHAIARKDDSPESWRAWWQMLMVYVRNAPDADVINEWTTANAEHFEALEKLDRDKYLTLIDHINTEIDKRAPADEQQ